MPKGKGGRKMGTGKGRKVKSSITKGKKAGY